MPHPPLLHSALEASLIHRIARSQFLSLRSQQARGMDARMAVGRYGEDVATRHLESLGYRILDRNWRCEGGEIDVVATLGGVVAIVEVKTRRSTTYGQPIEAITAAKAARLRRLAAAWLSAHAHVRAVHVRIDVVGVLIPRRGQPLIDYRQGVA